jgi:transmembrane sensor
MSKLDGLLRKVAAEEDALRAAERLPERLASRFQRFTPREPRQRIVPFAVGAAAAFLVVFLGLQALYERSALSVRVGAAGAAPLVGAWLGAPDSSQLPLEFSDGSRFELAPKSRARVVELARSSARVELASGSLDVQVTPGQASAWHIDAGPFGVRITGTRFVVSYLPAEQILELSMQEGQVELSGCVFGAGRKLAVGQRVRASCRAQTLDVSYPDVPASRLAAPAPSAQAPTPPAPSGASATTPAPARVEENGAPVAAASSPTPDEPDWLALARAGKLAEAYAAADREGFDDISQRSSAGALTLLADAARHARAPGKSEQALLTLRRRFAGSEDAALASFTLGRLKFDEYRAYTAAAEWFRTYLRERPQGVMAREALGRLMEATHRAGDASSAQAAAARYLREYPNGPHAELASRLVATP